MNGKCNFFQKYKTSEVARTCCLSSHKAEENKRQECCFSRHCGFMRSSRFNCIYFRVKDWRLYINSSIGHACATRAHVLNACMQQGFQGRSLRYLQYMSPCLGMMELIMVQYFVNICAWLSAFCANFVTEHQPR